MNVSKSHSHTEGNGKKGADPEKTVLTEAEDKRNCIQTKHPVYKFVSGLWIQSSSLLYLDTRVEQTSKYIVDNESQVCHIRERSDKSGKGKDRMKPLVPDWN